MKEYLKPELEIISLVAEEPIALDGSLEEDGGPTLSGGTTVNPF